MTHPSSHDVPEALSVGREAPDRNISLELVRVTEAAAMAAGRWVGRGDKIGGDGAAVDAMRMLIGTVSMKGVVVIGEGEKDEAPMLFNGEQIGDGNGPSLDIAVDPIDGTTLTSLGRPNAVSVIALAERGTMFLPEVIIASEAMVAAVAILEENLPAEQKEKKAGIAVLGTIEGDVHDIGKGIVATLMRVYGFQVHDLGRDVPLQRFVEEAREAKAQIVGSSALMTTTMVGQKQLEKLLKEAGIREQVKTMVGGAVVTQYWADKIGADAYAENAQEAVAKALELVEG